MAGKKQKQVSDPSLAHPHEAGSEVWLTQPAVHPIYGTIMFPILDHTDFYFKAAGSCLQDAKRYHNEILSKPLNKSNCRLVTDNQLLGNFFLNAQNVVLFSYLALEYFALSCAGSFGKQRQWKDRRLDQKIKHLISQELGIPRLPQDLCSAFGDIENRRHALNHPRPESVANADPREWDSVHLAWLLIGNYEKTYSDSLKIYEYLSVPYKEQMMRKSGPVTLTGVKRGIRFENQAKKNF
ncbi:MAG: hypothetical protein WCV68_00050 [Candidatus Paceibacterota bacterium]